MGKPKLPNGGRYSENKPIAITLIITVAFIAIGITFAIIGWHNEVLNWMKTTGIAFIAVALIPLSYFAYIKIKQRLDS